MKESARSDRVARVAFLSERASTEGERKSRRERERAGREKACARARERGSGAHAREDAG